MPANNLMKTVPAEDLDDPLVIEFLEAIGDRKYLDFADLQQKYFMKFWSNIVIHRYEDGDFTFVFFGTQLIKNFGYERTGAKLSKLTNGLFKDALFKVLPEIIATKKTVYVMDDLKILDQEHKSCNK